MDNSDHKCVVNWEKKQQTVLSFFFKDTNIVKTYENFDDKRLYQASVFSFNLEQANVISLSLYTYLSGVDVWWILAFVRHHVSWCKTTEHDQRDATLRSNTDTTITHTHTHTPQQHTNTHTNTHTHTLMDKNKMLWPLELGLLYKETIIISTDQPILK